MLPGNELSPRAGALAWAVIPFLALVAVHPLLVHGCSCGHDFEFHLESWIDAAQQMRHGTLHPHWAYTAAWSAGEPRFIFYPPLSWMLGALLTLLLPFASVPVMFTWIALTGAGLAMFSLARSIAGPRAALIAAAVYLANPYLLFTAFERTAYGELLAAAWMPLIVLAALQTRARIGFVALPIALLWLTNAPAAVIGSYGFALFFLLAFLSERLIAPSGHRDDRASGALAQGFPARRFLAAVAGAILGLALAAFYLVPAIYEQRWVQIAMATIPNMRIEDSFLFGHTSDAAHNQVLHTASLVAILILIATAIFLALAWLRRRRHVDAPRDANLPHLSSLLLVFAVATILIAFLLVRPSLFLWHLLPKLDFLQFPWRLLSLAGVILGAAVALALRGMRLSLRISALIAILLSAALSGPAFHVFRQACDADDLPAARQDLLASHHGMQPTDEYTPTDADNDVLRPDDPAFWLANDPAAFAPHTLPNPAQNDPSFDPSDFDDDQTISFSAPQRLTLHLNAPQDLILNLRRYPAWAVTRIGSGNASETLKPLDRDDGLIALALPAGTSTVNVHWRQTADESAGEAISAIAALALGAGVLRSRRIRD